MRSPSRTASGRRLSSTMAAASPDTKPSAESSNARQRPVGDSMLCADAAANLRGSSITYAPPARARSLSPSCRLRHAMCTASRLDEQAVSTVTAGPCTRRAWAIRPEAMLDALHANPYGPSMVRDWAATSW